VVGRSSGFDAANSKEKKRKTQKSELTDGIFNVSNRLRRWIDPPAIPEISPEWKRGSGWDAWDVWDIKDVKLAG
jgi:hypothetical protein